MDRAIRLHLMARYLEGLARRTNDPAMLRKASAMTADAEMFADLGLGHFADDPPW